MSTITLTKKSTNDSKPLSARNAAARQEFDALRANAESILRDLSYVLHLTRKVRQEIEIDAESTETVGV